HRVEAGEHRGVPAREGGEGAGGGHDEPDLVAVPEGSDGPDDGAPARLVVPDHAVQHPDAEVEALEQEEPGPEHGEDEEPEGDEGHGDLSGRADGSWSQ